MIEFKNHCYHIQNYKLGCVEPKFYEVLNLLGDPDQNYYLVFITLRLRRGSDMVDAFKVCNGLEFKLSKRFLGKHVSNQNRLTFIPAIEYNKDLLGNHVHALLKIPILNNFASDVDINSELKSFIDKFQEINHDDPRRVNIRKFPFSEQTSDLGDTIAYMVKTTTEHWNPLYRHIPNKDNAKHNTKNQYLIRKG